MSNIVHYDFRRALERFNAEIYSNEMKKYRLETLARNANDACSKIVCLLKELCIENIRCVAIYSGCSDDRSINDEVLKAYFPDQEKEVCYE